MKIFITGLNGFLGSNFAKSLLNDHTVAGIGSSLDSPVTELSLYRKMSLPQMELIQFFKDFTPDIVIHCAGSASVPFSILHPEADFQAGPNLVMHVLEALRLSNTKALFIFPSSAAVYGNPSALPIKEETIIAPLSPYGHHKAISENIIREFNTLYNIPYLILRIFSCYGCGLKKQLLWDVCQKILNNTLELHGTGNETRDFIHISDLTLIIKHCLNNQIINTTINAASGEETKISKIVNLLVKYMQSNTKPTYSGHNRPGDPLRWKADITKLSNLGFHNLMKLENGIHEYTKWIKSHTFQAKSKQRS